MPLDVDGLCKLWPLVPYRTDWAVQLACLLGIIAIESCVASGMFKNSLQASATVHVGALERSQAQGPP